MKFTIEAIQSGHRKVKSGAGFPGYIQAIKNLGVSLTEFMFLTEILNISTPKINLLKPEVDMTIY